jgi:hypothetical protein
LTESGKSSCSLASVFAHSTRFKSIERGLRCLNLQRCMNS